MDRREEQPPLTVKVWGTDKNGRDFSQTAEAREYTDHGALLKGVEQCVAPGGIIGLQYKEASTLARILEVWSNHLPLLSVQLFDPALCPWKSVLGITTPEDQKERRRAPRYKIAVAIDIRQERSNAPTHFRTSDISTSGFYIETILPLGVGTELNVAIWLGAEKLLTDAIVRTCHASVGMGVQFVDMAPQDEKRLAEFLERALQQQNSASAPPASKPPAGEIAQDPLLEPS
jgi:hypothetical protein